MNVVFMGSPAFVAPALDALLALGHTVVGVFMPPDKPAGRGQLPEPPELKAIALEKGLPVFQPPSLRTPQGLGMVASLRPQLIVVAAYGKILPPDVLSLPKYGCLNLHPSLLPRYRGPSPVVTALLEGEEVTGVTLMIMDEGMDTGPVLARRQERVLPHDTALTLTQRLFLRGAELLRETLPLWEAGKVTPQPQDSANATYTQKVSKEDGFLDWQLPATVLERRVRAYTPWPTAYTRWRGKLLKVLKAHLAAPAGAVSDAAPGTVTSLGEKGSAGVVTGQGVLCLDEAQMEGKKPVVVQEFLRGYPDFIGSKLPS